MNEWPSKKICGLTGTSSVCVTSVLARTTVDARSTTHTIAEVEHDVSSGPRPCQVFGRGAVSEAFPIRLGLSSICFLTGNERVGVAVTIGASELRGSTPKTSSTSRAEDVSGMDASSSTTLVTKGIVGVRVSSVEDLCGKSQTSSCPHGVDMLCNCPSLLAMTSNTSPFSSIFTSVSSPSILLCFNGGALSMFFMFHSGTTLPMSLVIDRSPW